MDVWESDQVDYDKKSMVREVEHTQRKMETQGYKDGVDLVNVDAARQKGFEDGFKIGALRGDYKGRLMGFCLGLRTVQNVEILTRIVDCIEKMDWEYFELGDGQGYQRDE